MDSTDQHLAFAILEYLEHCKSTDVISSEEDKESADVAIQCISQIFNLDTSSDLESKEYSIKPTNLKSIFNVFLDTKKKSLRDNDETSKQEILEKAEKLKNEGNVKMNANEYEEAISLYNNAIQLNPFNPVYHANKSAAYMQLHSFKEAIESAKRAIEIDETYVKGYSRLANAYLANGNLDEAIRTYEHGLALDPDHEIMKSGLKKAQAKLAAAQDTVCQTERSTGDGSGGGGGGGFDLAGLLNNPALANMANQLMGGNPAALGNLMNNPAVQQMMRNLSNQGGNAGGNPLSALMNNPDIMNMAQQFMGSIRPPNNPNNNS